LISDFITNYAQFYRQLSDSMITWYISLNRPILDAIHYFFDKTFYFFLYLTVIVSVFFMIISIYELIRRKSKREYEFNEKDVPFVTIQIPTYNELAALNCAQRCLDMDYPKDKYEIIIGDDSNKPEISKKIDKFASKSSEKYPNMIKITRRGANVGYKPGNLNHMLKYTNGEIIVIFDSDFLPEQGFLKRIVAPFQADKKIAGVQTRWKFINNNQNIFAFLGSLVVEGFHHVYLPFMKRVGKVSFLCGSGEAVRKSLLVKMGGWKSGSLTEDIEFSVRLLTAGHNIVYLEDLEVLCEAPFTAKDLYRQQMRWAFGVISALATHFFGIVTSRRISLKRKFFIHFQASGYMFTMLVGILFLTGMISLISNRPAPIDWPKFLSETAVNFAITSGIFLVSFVALLRTKRMSMWWKAIFSCLTIGLVVIYYVNKGIVKALLGGQMEWFMLNKKGNTKRIR
jgi:cellulose synthase/poly-beta-1,6-N-acetylglucosamine synthase-like glycosyltransferase